MFRVLKTLPTKCRDFVVGVVEAVASHIHTCSVWAMSRGMTSHGCDFFLIGTILIVVSVDSFTLVVIGGASFLVGLILFTMDDEARK